jgi:hypothetical protein
MIWKIIEEILEIYTKQNFCIVKFYLVVLIFILESSATKITLKEQIYKSNKKEFTLYALKYLSFGHWKTHAILE